MSGFLLLSDVSLMFRWTVVSVVLAGLASRFVVKEVFSKMVCFICLRLGFLVCEWMKRMCRKLSFLSEL